MISLIVAATKNNAIGKDNKLLFHIKEDLRFFKETTINKTIIMGRKTFEALPGVLPLRKHIVITRNNDYKIDSSQVEIRHSLDEVLEEVRYSNEEIFVIGGDEIFRQTLDKGVVDKIYLTRIDKTVEDADTFFPEISDDNFEVVDRKVLTDDATVFVYENIIKSSLQIS